MKQVKSLKIIRFAIYFVLMALGFWLGTSYESHHQDTQKQSPQPIQLIQVCPDAWYDNEMPMSVFGNGTVNNNSRQQFIVNGHPININQIDVGWVENHCKVDHPQKIY